MGPRDTSAASNDALGGNLFAVARVKADFPIGLPEEYGITGGVFAHAGSVWGLDTEPFAGAGDFALRASVGAALNWETPIGPLQFSYAIPVLKETYDEEQRFAISISTGF